MLRHTIKAHTQGTYQGTLNGIANKKGDFMSSPTKIEKVNLEAHVELCAERYNNLEEKLDNLETRMDKLEGHMVDIKNCLATNERVRNGQMIKFSITIIGVLATGIFAFIQAGIFIY